MDKQEIVKVLQEMQSVYTGVLKIDKWKDLIFYCHVNRISHGFCYYLSHYSLDIKNIRWDVLTTLQRDLEKVDLSSCDLGYWYPPLSDYQNKQEALENAIYPRIENLYRTIARLQTEIQQTQQ